MTPGNSEGQGRPAGYSPQGHRTGHNLETIQQHAIVTNKFRPMCKGQRLVSEDSTFRQ